MSRVLLPLGLLAVAGAAPAAQEPVRVGPADIHFAWTTGGSDAAAYRVEVSHNGGPFVTEQVVSRAEAWVSSYGGETIAVRVAARDVNGQETPLSHPSVAVRVLPPREDADRDGRANELDACPLQIDDGRDEDGDGIPDVCDSCPFVSDARGIDLDSDGVGNACDPDKDGDGIPDAADLCPRLAQAATTDSDRDGYGDACDPCDVYRWSETPVKPPDQHIKDSGVLFKHLNTPEAQQIRVEGKFSPLVDDALVDPSATGLSFSVRDEAGPIYSLGIPPGYQGSSPCDPQDGWSLSYWYGNAIWKYSNASGSLDPVSCGPAAAKLVTAIVRDKRATKGWVEYVIEFKDLKLDHVPALPARAVRASVALSDRESRWESGWAARAAACGETFLAAPADSGLAKPFCKPTYYSGEMTKIVCRDL